MSQGSTSHPEKLKVPPTQVPCDVLQGSVLDQLSHCREQTAEVHRPDTA